MTFLSKLASVLTTIGKVVAVASGFEPLIAPFLGSSKAASTVQTVTNDLTQIGQVVVSAEALLQGPGTGPAKLTAATPLVMQILKTTEMFAGKKLASSVSVKNPDGTVTAMPGDALFQRGAMQITSGMADLLNAVDPSHVS